MKSIGFTHYNVYCEIQNIRTDGRVEMICPHGVGHTIDAPKKYKKKLGKYWSVHGCDGCCGQKPIKSGIV